jgi:hypothetical protein
MNTKEQAEETNSAETFWSCFRPSIFEAAACLISAFKTLTCAYQNTQNREYVAYNLIKYTVLEVSALKLLK